MSNRIFDSVALNKPKRNKFDLSREVKMSGNMGKLYPIMCEEILPNDSFSIKSEIMVRMAPMVAPLMHRVDVFTHYFFVPNRLVWDEWDPFITGGEQGTDLPVFPTMEISNSSPNSWTKGRLGDYFGIPVQETVTNASGPEISALPFRAYQEIYNEYYRDQNLESKVNFSKASGPVDPATFGALTAVRNRPWEKDYFTSALPWPQRGGEAQVPLGDINYSQLATTVDVNGDEVAGGAITHPGGNLLSDAGDLGLHNIDSISGSINDLRKASRLQEWLERSARTGSRYIEVIKANFGITSSDARLQRPEYLGGSKQPMTISEVLNTAGDLDQPTELQPVGDMAGHGISVGRSGINRKFEEHGFIIGILSVLPKTAYSQGIHRKWSRTDKFDYYWPTFANLGEQEIYNQEIYQDTSDPSINLETFGYQQRYAEYKYASDTVHGDFRDDLSYWQMAREFTVLPALNSDFIQSDPRFDIFAIKDETVDHLYIQIYHKVSALRPMPFFSIPSL